MNKHPTNKIYHPQKHFFETHFETQLRKTSRNGPRFTEQTPVIKMNNKMNNTN